MANVEKLICWICVVFPNLTKLQLNPRKHVLNFVYASRHSSLKQGVWISLPVHLHGWDIHLSRAGPKSHNSEMNFVAFGNFIFHNLFPFKIQTLLFYFCIFLIERMANIQKFETWINVIPLNFQFTIWCKVVYSYLIFLSHIW